MKKKLTRFLALIMALTIVLSLGACGKDNEDTTTTETTIQGGDVNPDETTTDGSATDGTTTDGTTAEDGTTSEDGTTADGGATTDAPSNGETPGKPEGKAQILAAYTEVMNYAKTAKPAYNKKEYQALPKEHQKMESKLVGYLLPQAERYMTTVDEANIEVQEKGTDMRWFPVYKAKKGCLLTNAGAIKTAKCDVLPNGNFKITIVLKDEHNPEPYDEGKGIAPSYYGAMFNPLSRKDIDKELIYDDQVSKLVKNVDYDLRYYDGTAILEYNPKTKQIVNLEQYMSVFIDIRSGKVLGLINLKGTAVLNNTMKCWGFKY